DREKKLDVAGAVREALRELESREDLVPHAISLLRYHWPAAQESADLNAALAQAHARRVEPLELKNEADRAPHKRHREAGTFHAQAALRADANRGDAHYWYGALLLHTADAEQSYSRLKEALAEMQTAKR